MGQLVLDSRIVDFSWLGLSLFYRVIDRPHLLFRESGQASTQLSLGVVAKPVAIKGNVTVFVIAPMEIDVVTV